jgi:hypothetical protein
VSRANLPADPPTGALASSSGEELSLLERILTDFLAA